MSWRMVWFTWKNRIFQWNAEKEENGGSIVFTVAGCIHFVKYKDMTIIYFGRGKDFIKARKHVVAY